MSETAPEATTTTETATVETTETKPAEVDWKAKSREWEKRAKENSAAAQKLAELEESQKTEAQRLSEAREAAERRAAEAEAANIRYRVAVAKGLPADLVDRLRGDSEEDIAADADALLALVQAAPPTPKPDLTQGHGAPPQGDDMNALIRRGLGR